MEQLLRLLEVSEPLQASVQVVRPHAGQYWLRQSSEAAHFWYLPYKRVSGNGLILCCIIDGRWEVKRISASRSLQLCHKHYQPASHPLTPSHTRLALSVSSTAPPAPKALECVSSIPAVKARRGIELEHG